MTLRLTTLARTTLLIVAAAASADHYTIPPTSMNAYLVHYAPVVGSPTHAIGSLTPNQDYVAFRVQPKPGRVYDEVVLQVTGAGPGNVLPPIGAGYLDGPEHTPVDMTFGEIPFVTGNGGQFIFDPPLTETDETVTLMITYPAGSLAGLGCSMRLHEPGVGYTGFFGPGLAPADTIAPIITGHPEAQVVNPGASVDFSVTILNTTGFTFQWQQDDLPLTDGPGITGATTDTLTIDATAERIGSYSVVITGTHASTTSNTALLAILPSCAADTNGNGFVDFDDLNEVLSNWNTTCP